MTAPETLELKSVGAHVLLVTLNRPEASNAFNTQMAWDLIEVFERLSVSANGTRVVVLTGAGDKAFCAGGDLKERKGMTDEAWQAQHLVYERMIRAVITCPLPVMGVGWINAVGLLFCLGNERFYGFSNGHCVSFLAISYVDGGLRRSDLCQSARIDAGLINSFKSRRTPIQRR